MRDLTNLKTYIIDSEDPHEIDDAISLEITEGDSKKLWIHISNPCGLFLLDSEIDRNARKNNSSLYLTNQYIPMLPKDIIDLANIEENKISQTISASIIFDENGAINDYEIMEALIKPNYQLTYEDADEILDLEPKEEYELLEIRNLLLRRLAYRKRSGAIVFDTSISKLQINKENIEINKMEKTISQKIISEAMILMGYVTSKYLIDNKLPAAYRCQKINCNPNEILQKYKESEIKYIVLKQYMGKSYVSTKANKHECLGLDSYVQCTSPLRRYLDLLIQRQVYNKIKGLKTLDKNCFLENIDYSKSRQLEINNIYKNDKIKYLSIFFKNENSPYFKIIFVKWINYKRNIALVYFPDYILETIINLYISIDIYTNKVYKIKYNINNNNKLDFTY